MDLSPQIREYTAVWDLNLVLNYLMKTPFEPMTTCFLLHLSMKMAFFMAISPARRVGEMGGLMENHLFFSILQGENFVTTASKVSTKGIF